MVWLDFVNILMKLLLNILFQVCAKIGYPFNNGDWFEEIPWMLAPETRALQEDERSNFTVEQGIEYFNSILKNPKPTL